MKILAKRMCIKLAEHSLERVSHGWKILATCTPQHFIQGELHMQPHATFYFVVATLKAFPFRFLCKPVCFVTIQCSRLLAQPLSFYSSHWKLENESMQQHSNRDLRPPQLLHVQFKQSPGPIEPDIECTCTFECIMC